MGCGISVMDAEAATQSRPSNGPLRLLKAPRPATIKKLSTKQGDIDSLTKQPQKSISRHGKGVILVMQPIMSHHEVSEKQGCLDGKKIEEKKMEKQERVNEEEEEENNGRDDMIIKIRHGSLSFRDYCIDYDSNASSSKRKYLVVEPSFKDLCNDFDLRESSKNEGDDDSTQMLNKSQDKEGFDLNKGPVKKERRRKVHGNKEKGKSRKKKNFPKFSHREKS